MDTETRSFFPDIKTETWKHTLLLSFQSLGVVYGHLSIAPLYVFRIISDKAISSEESLYGLLSFIFWTLTLIPLLKYVFIVLRADDNGEGGPFALYSLLCQHAKVGLLPNHEVSIDSFITNGMGSFSQVKKESRAKKAIEKHKSSHYVVLFMALLGSCVMISDGVLIPAISVFSASSGLEHSLSEICDHISSPSSGLRHTLSKVVNGYVAVPSSCIILVGLFVMQQYGTHKIGFMLAPIVTIWLLFIGGVGLFNIFHWNHRIVYALSPEYLYRFLISMDTTRWRALGGVVLCVAGSDAIFADLGHFSKRSIKIAFVVLVYPSLILSYMGQTAFISRKYHNSVIDHVTYLGASVPESLHHIFTVLALLASVVRSQASITGTFSIVNQCVALGCFPRVKVVHTSDKIHGQIYIPDVNWILMILCLTITIGFRNIERLGNAFGLAMIIGLLITTCLMSLIISLCWEKNILISACFLIFFGSIEALYLSACLLNFHKGAWFLVILLVVFMVTMLVWHYGTMKKYESDMQNKLSVEWLTGLSPALGVARVPGIGFIYTDLVTGIPAFFSHFITNLPAFHQVLVFISFKSMPVPYVPLSRRYLIGRLGPKEFRIYRCIIRHGYRDSIRDTDDFEDQLISRLGEFVSVEENYCESFPSPEGRMIVIGSPKQDGNTLIPLEETNMEALGSVLEAERLQSSHSLARRKKVRFQLPPNSPQMCSSIREELRELVVARESGSAYFLGQPHIFAGSGSNFLKKLMIIAYSFLDTNCREPSAMLNIPHAALLGVGIVCSI